MDRVSSVLPQNAAMLNPSVPGEGNTRSGDVGELPADIRVVRLAPSDLLVTTETNARKTQGLPESVASYWVFDERLTQYLTFKDDFGQAINEFVKKRIANAEREIADYKNIEYEAFDNYRENLLASVDELRRKFEEKTPKPLIILK